MDAIFNAYLDADFLSLVGSFASLAAAGLLLGVCVYFLGWFVAWVISVLRRLT